MYYMILFIQFIIKINIKYNLHILFQINVKLFIIINKNIII